MESMHDRNKQNKIKECAFDFDLIAQKVKFDWLTLDHVKDIKPFK